MINLSSDRIGTTTNDTLDKNIVGDIEEKEAVSRNPSSGKSIGLGWSAGETIEEPSTLLAIRLVKAILDLLFHHHNTNATFVRGKGMGTSENEINNCTANRSDMDQPSATN